MRAKNRKQKGTEWAGGLQKAGPRTYLPTSHFHIPEKSIKINIEYGFKKEKTSGNDTVHFSNT